MPLSQLDTPFHLSFHLSFHPLLLRIYQHAFRVYLPIKTHDLATGFKIIGSISIISIQNLVN